MAVLDVVDDPETALRKRLNQRTATAPGVPGAIVDPVYEAPPPTPAPPPAVYAGSAPVTPVVPTATTQATRDPKDPDYGADPEPPPAPAPTTPAPTTPAPASTWTPPNPWTFDPRLGTDPVWANSPEGLAEANRQDRFMQMMQGRLYPGPQNGDIRSWFLKLTEGIPPSPDFLKWLEPRIKQYGITLAPNAAGVVGKIRLPTGEIVDVIQSAGTGGTAWQWLTGPGGGGGGGTTMPTTSSVFQDQLRAILMQRLGKAQLPVDENDPFIREPMTAAGVQAARMQQKERTELAERLAATGDTSRSLEMGIQQSAERNAVGLGSLKAKLINDEYNKRREEMLDLLQMAFANNDSEMARQIQLALTAIDQARWDYEQGLA